MSPHASVSVVVATLDGGERLVALVEQLSAVLDEPWPDHEIVLVDDGGSPADPTWQTIARLAGGSAHITGVRLAARAGQLPAFFAGVAASRGRRIVAIDDDFEIDPSHVTAVLAPLDEGFDAVSGWRVDRRRRSTGARIALSSAYWWAMRRIARVPFHDPGCGLKAFRREVLVAVAAEGGSALQGLRPLWAVSRHAPRTTDVRVPWEPGHRPSTYRWADLVRLAADLAAHVARRRIGRSTRPGREVAPYEVAEVVRAEPGRSSAPGHRGQTDL